MVASKVPAAPGMKPSEGPSPVKLAMPRGSGNPAGSRFLAACVPEAPGFMQNAGSAIGTSWALGLLSVTLTRRVCRALAST